MLNMNETRCLMVHGSCIGTVNSSPSFRLSCQVSRPLSRTGRSFLDYRQAFCCIHDAELPPETSPSSEEPFHQCHIAWHQTHVSTEPNIKNRVMTKILMFLLRPSEDRSKDGN